MGTDHEFKQAVIPGAEATRIGKRGPGGMNGNDADFTGGKQETHEDFRTQSAHQGFGKRVHGS